MLKTLVDKKTLFLIALVSIASLWNLLYYYFSYEDLSFFYAYQIPQNANLIFNSNYPHIIIPYLKFLFILFGYNPLPYNILSILLFAFLSLLVYVFSLLWTENKKIALYAGLIFACGYFGVDTFIWNTLSGIDGGLGIAFVLLTLISYLLFIKKRNKLYLLSLILCYLVALFLFPARSYMLPFILLILIYRKNMSYIKYGFYVLLLLTPLFLITKSHSSNGSMVLPHRSIDMLSYITALVGNLGVLFLPLSYLPQLVFIVLGILILILAFLRKDIRKLVILLLISLLFWAFVEIINNQDFVISPGTNKNFISFAIFSSPILAILFKKSLGVIVIILFCLLTLFSAQVALSQRLHTESMQTRYFYTTVQKYIPKTIKKAAVLVYLEQPYPPDPFTSGSVVPGGTYLAGFYGKSKDQLFATSEYHGDYHGFPDTIEFAKKNNLSLSNLFVYTYSLGNLENVSSDAREALKGGETTLTNTKAINLIGLVPLRVNFTVQPITESTNLPATQRNFLTWRQSVTAKAHPNIGLNGTKVANLIDDDFNTTWIPNLWEKYDEVSLSFQPMQIDRVVWANARLNSYPQRTPIDYTIEVTPDGKTWQQVKHITNKKPLKTGEYSVDTFSYPKPIVELRYRIYKTPDGSLPSIDELWPIPTTLDSLNYDQIVSLIHNAKRHICINWSSDGINYTPDAIKCTSVEKTQQNISMEIEPQIRKISGIKITDDKAMTLHVESITIAYPRYENNAIEVPSK